eukprot:950900-Pleurochrysis_carterae.AAC.15
MPRMQCLGVFVRFAPRLCPCQAREREIREAAQSEKARLETERELDSERAFNSASSRSTPASSPMLTATMAPALSPRLIMPAPLLS